jgi:hypothetical protein
MKNRKTVELGLNWCQNIYVSKLLVDHKTGFGWWADVPGHHLCSLLFLTPFVPKKSLINCKFADLMSKRIECYS